MNRKPNNDNSVDWYRVIYSRWFRLSERLEVTELTVFQTACYPSKTLGNDMWMLDPEGILWLFEGYTWNGASGPTLDSNASRQGTAVHDALYYCLSQYPQSNFTRKQADRELLIWGIRGGMNVERALAWYRSVRLAGGLWLKRGKRSLRKIEQQRRKVDDG